MRYSGFGCRMTRIEFGTQLQDLAHPSLVVSAKKGVVTYVSELRRRGNTMGMGGRGQTLRSVWWSLNVP